MRRLAQALGAFGLACALVVGARATGVTAMLLGAAGASTASLTLTAGSEGAPPANGRAGYCAVASGQCASALGSVSSASLGPQTLVLTQDAYVSSACSTNVYISGFNVDPGQAWLLKVTFNGLTLTGAGAASYAYASGIAEWGWDTCFVFAGGMAYPGTIEFK